jgi:hypothetical protein
MGCTCVAFFLLLFEERDPVGVGCNAPNFGVEFFSFFFFTHQIPALPLSFFLFFSLNLDHFQSYSEIRLEISCKTKP